MTWKYGHSVEADIVMARGHKFCLDSKRYWRQVLNVEAKGKNREG